jgi:hypothetical protein
MWEETAVKLSRLAALDRRRQVFGADYHDYELFSTLSAEELREVEDAWGARFPQELRAFYQEVGDGVAGPYYGVNPSVRVTPYRPSEPYTEVATFRALASHASDDNYVTVNRDDLTGLFGVIDEGCGHEICVVTKGPHADEVIMLSIEGSLHETGLTFHRFYEQWLDRELGKFDFVKDLMSSVATFEEIETGVLDKFGTYDAPDIIVSVADVEKPVDLFGTTHSRIYHGATQKPWYESVLREWREANS